MRSEAASGTTKTTSDSITIQRPVAAGSPHALAQPGATTPAPNDISNVIKVGPLGAPLRASPDPYRIDVKLALRLD